MEKNMNDENIKESLDTWMENGLEEFGAYTSENVEEAMGKWQKFSEIQDEEGNSQLIFVNTYLNRKVLVIEDEVIGFLAEGNYVFNIHQSGEIMVSDYDYFKQNGCASDWELTGFVVLPYFVSEIASGVFSSEEDVSETRKAFIELGFIEDQSFSDFVN